MENYTWEKNQAIVNRLYYVERTFETSLFFASAYTATNLLYVKKGYFVSTMRPRILPVWGAFAGLNAFIAFVMLKPLRAEEIRIQVKKRLTMGKWLYSLYHLDEEEE